jgi:pentatricopeptide repeat protein
MIKASRFTLDVDSERKIQTADDKEPAVVYCHCNVGNWLEAKEVIELMVEEGFTVFAFDFSVSASSRSGAHLFETQAVHNFFCAITYMFPARARSIHTIDAPALPSGASIYKLTTVHSWCVLYSQGCGLSDGTFVTLGVKEVEDLAAVVRYIQQDERISTLGLWGRSMGAVTALLYSNMDPDIAGTVRFTDGLS